VSSRAKGSALVPKRELHVWPMLMPPRAREEAFMEAVGERMGW